MRYDASKFWAQVDIPDKEACWNWLGSKDIAGYGMFKGQKVHRLVFFIQGQRVASHYDVDHACENKSCTNPSHLVIMRHDDHSRKTRRTTHRTTKKEN